VARHIDSNATLADVRSENERYVLTLRVTARGRVTRTMESLGDDTAFTDVQDHGIIAGGGQKDIAMISLRRSYQGRAADVLATRHDPNAACVRSPTAPPGWRPLFFETTESPHHRFRSRNPAFPRKTEPLRDSVTGYSFYLKRPLHLG
jgi:hypothetical protein